VVEEHQQVAQVGRKERHLVGPRDEDLSGPRDRLDRRLHLGARRLARRLLDVHVVGGQCGLVVVLVDAEERPGLVGARARRGAAVFLARGLLELGEALEPERLREAHDGGRRGVGSARQRLGGLEGRLVEVVDDVLGDVLLGARELVEAVADVGGERLVPVHPRRGRDGR
jgi:hypothetical protein